MERIVWASDSPPSRASWDYLRGGGFDRALEQAEAIPNRSEIAVALCHTVKSGVEPYAHDPEDFTLRLGPVS